MTRIESALARMQFARRYSTDLIDTIPTDAWFVMPAGCPTHVAWQVGHLAMAEMRMFLFRYRGDRPGDDDTLPPSYRTLFGIESVPSADPAVYPTAAEIRATFDRVHAAVLEQVPTHAAADFDLPLSSPHRLCRTRGECLDWASMHEMTHAGQIGLLRRLLGSKPVW